LLLFLTSQSVAFAIVTETWDNGHRNWRYVAQGHSEPLITHVPSGGVGGSGFIQVDYYQGNQFEWGDLGGDLDWVYWPAFVYPTLDGLTPVIDFTGADVTINMMGSADLNMQSGQLYFYIGKWNGDTSQWSLIRHNKPIAIGNAAWQSSTITLGSVIGAGSDDWTLLDGGDYTLAQTLAHPTEFGFTITGVQNDEENPTGVLSFDEFSTTGSIVIPEPTTMTLLVLTGLGLFRRRKA
jgi:hypothetical protein